MANTKMEKKVSALMQDASRHRIWRLMMCALICMVGLTTVYTLILPAITMEKEPLCGLEEHVHGPECFLDENVLVCEMNEGYADSGHIHTEDCYGEAPTLACPMEESEGHIHVGECYATTTVLFCGQEESEDHIHSEECFTEKSTLVCELPESEGHQHSDTCYVMERQLLCGLGEAQAHTHSDECFEHIPKLICEIPEHTHDDSCFEQPDTTADLETAVEWEASLSDVELTGDWSRDVVAIAQTQLGYEESNRNFIWNENGNKQGYTRYGAWYGHEYSHWCAIFVSFCLNYAEVPEEAIPYEASCQRWIETLTTMELYRTPVVHSPVSGDIIFFDYDLDGTSDHVGFVEEVLYSEDGKLTQINTIEGNTGDQVQRHEYALTDSAIIGYVSLSEVRARYDRLYPDVNGSFLSYEDDLLSVSITIHGMNEALPENTELVVTPVTLESDPGRFSAVVAFGESVLGETKLLSALRLFDLQLFSNGVPLELAPSVDVQVDATFHSPLFTAEDIARAAELRAFTLEPLAAEEAYAEGGTLESTSHEMRSAVNATSPASAPQIKASELEGVYTDLKEGITGLSYLSNGLAPFAVMLTDETVTGNFWQRIYSDDELVPGDTYMIVSAEGNYALTNNYGYTNVPNSTFVVLQPVKGNPNYYSVDNVDDNMRWTFQNLNGNPAMANVANGGTYRLDPYYDVYEGTYNYQRNYWEKFLFTYNWNSILNIMPSPNTGCWNIKEAYNDNTNADAYLNNAGLDNAGSDGSFFGDTTQYWFNNGSFATEYYYHRNARTSDMLILRLVNVTLTIPGDVLGDGDPYWEEAEKPDYIPYINVSEAQTGTYQYADGILAGYDSDPSTSKLESLFGNHTPLNGQTNYQAQQVDDGKVLIDKSVVYRNDDYQAVGDYEEGTFGVVLSALGQDFNIDTEFMTTPIDLVLVIDWSNSMQQTDPGQDRSRAQATIDATNDALQIIMSAHPDNRVGVVTFNSGMVELLELGRYTPDAEGRFLTYDGIAVTAVGSGNSSIREGGTYTQMGIAGGAAMFLDNPDTTYTTVVNGQNVTVPRKPVFILISDGEPTHCTSHYMDVLNGPHYGDGGSWDYNCKGIQGYYTILSANYYKRMIGIHYDTPATFYTIGFGMAENDYSLVGGSHVSNHYKATVMHPTENNIAALSQAVTGHETLIENMLSDLLNGIYVGETIKLGSFSQQGTVLYPHSYIPVNQSNPYRPDYNYANRSFLGNIGYDDLMESLGQIINANSRISTQYAFETLGNNPIVISDPIGDGMEIKGDPVLRYNGVNYNYSGKSIEGTTVTYTYSGTVSMDPFSGKTVDLGSIQVQVSEDASQLQTVTMSIPASALPVYSPDHTRSFYYEALPVRLIYQVGLSMEGQSQVEQIAAGQTLTFYTNRYSGGAHAEGTMMPSGTNPYYQNENWRFSTDKTSNPTSTDSTSIVVGTKSGQTVLYTLGNNGRLIFTKQSVRELSVEKKWLDYDGNEQTSDMPSEITATLYRTYAGADGNTVQEDVVVDFTLSAATNWKKTFSAAELNEVSGREYLYYVTENTVEGYDVSYANDGVPGNTPENPILISNRYRYGEYVLPETGGLGAGIFYTNGLVILIFALMFGYVVWRKRDERRIRAAPSSRRSK